MTKYNVCKSIFLVWISNIFYSDLIRSETICKLSFNVVFVNGIRSQTLPKLIIMKVLDVIRSKTNQDLFVEAIELFYSH